MKLKFKLFSIIVILCILIGSGIVLASNGQSDVNGDNSINDFYADLVNAKGTFNMTKDYKFQGNDSGQVMGGGNLTINGNGHKIDGSNNLSGISIDNSGKHGKIVINNLTLTNIEGLVIYSESCELVLNDIVIMDDSNGSEIEGLVSIFESDNVILNNCTFKSNSNSSAVSIMSSNVTVKNSIFLGSGDAYSAIVQDRGSLKIDNCSFRDCHSDYGGALNFKGDYLSIKNSNFSNSYASITGGAIVGKYFPRDIDDKPVSSDAMLIENCIFSKVSSSSNGGAIYMDLDSGSKNIPQRLNVVNCSFNECSSKFGGAIVNLGGALNIENSRFADNAAKSTGGAIYTSWTNLNVTNSTLSNNAAKSNASAIYLDNGTFTVNNSNLSGNKVVYANGGNFIGQLFNNISNGNVIYANDAENHFINSTFDNGGVIYGNFIRDSEIKNVSSTDLLSLNNTDYIVSVENKAIKLNLKNNTANIDKLPSTYDSRDFGWASPLKFQGDNLACWAFATAGALECSLLKSTGVLYNLSENNIQDIQLRYNPIGDTRNNVTGFAYSGLGYALSWNGPVMAQDDPYDERGMISEVSHTNNRIHLQDAKIIFPEENDTVNSIKHAIMEYGAVTIQFAVGDFKYNYQDTAEQPTHFVSLIGWNDSIPAKDFKDMDDNKSPSKPGGWIIKDSEGSEVGDKGYDYLSYYDKSFLANDYYAIVPQAAAVAYIFENTEDYHVNYQTDLTGLAGFDGNFTYYSNEFTSKYNESIGAVGTYFNDSGIEYSFDVYVNGKLAHSQNGTSEFAGFKTIVLDKYVPIKTGDKFKVVFKNNAVPYQAFSRQHYIPGMSFVSDDGQSWKDISLENKTVCLKVYTINQN
ncbi:lectin like domain-containing protein [Methanobrevibacter sp.]|uniref:lectin like domain-containing protein n=1 Tax=Methanobrevibacter sp. TaxID=66852 RepID=UPI00386DF005